MPSISKAKLDEMNSQIERLDRQLTSQKNDTNALQRQVHVFDEILEKITRAADGWPLINAQNVNASGFNNVGMGHYEPPHRCVPFTPDELRQGELEALREQSMMFAERLAAVKAVTQFAKEHKA